MTTPAADPHIAAFLDQLAGQLDMPVFDGQVTGTPAGQYVVCYPDGGMLTAAAADGDPQDLVITVQVTACGPTRRDAGAAADAVREAVAGQYLEVPGRYCDQVEQILAIPAQRDDTARPTTDLAVFYAVAQYRWLTVPA